MPACRINLRDQIIQEANSQGVPPEIALSVAAQESGTCHWRADGAVVLGVPTNSGQAIGVFQLMPATAAMLGVDPYDVDDNIHGGVLYLAQLYAKYGDWNAVLQHYYGIGKHSTGPNTADYASAVLSRADRYGLALQVFATAPQPPLAAAALIGRAAGAVQSAAQSLQDQAANLSPKTKTVLVTGSVIAAGLLLAYNLSDR